MQIKHEIRGAYLLLNICGRLDATWSDYFTESLLAHIRKGHHKLLLEAEKLSYLSSAGIRSLMTLHKELHGVQGSFSIINASDFVRKTLEATGLGLWLAECFPGDMPINDLPGKEHGAKQAGAIDEVYVLNPEASLQLKVHDGWRPWGAASSIQRMDFHASRSSFALGIGATAMHEEAGKEQFGEFLAVAGNVVVQPPEASGRPDYLMADKDFVPELHAIQALICQGEMSHQFRFSSNGDKRFFTVSELAGKALRQTGSDMAAFVILGEIDGLVGASLIRSPSHINDSSEINFPETKNWLSFCGERVYGRNQALLFGVVANTGNGKEPRLLARLPGKDTLATHVHAAIFPYQPLQNGQIAMKEQVEKFFNGSPPVGVLHLVADDRPAVGLGESSLIHGACWCAPVNNPEVLL